MPSDVIFLARHGETVWNRAGRKQGHLDSPLTEAGTAQAKALAVYAEAERVDAVFTSPLRRSVETARETTERLGLALHLVDGLSELHHGSFAGMTSVEIEDQFPGTLNRRSEDKFGWRFPGGESYLDADRRAKAALRIIEASSPYRPLIVSHEMVGRMLLRNLLGLSAERALSIKQPNSVVFRVDVTKRIAEPVTLR